MMLLRHGGSSFRPLHIVIWRRHYSDDKPISKATTPPKFITQIAHLLGIEWSTSREIISQHRKLLAVKYEDIAESCRTLEQLNYTKEQYREHPSLLYTGAVSLLNRHKILEECGCVKITAGVLSKYIVIMNRQIRIIKIHGFIPDETNVFQRLIEQFKDVQLAATPQADDRQLLKIAREDVLNLYLKERLEMSDVQLKKLWYSYNRIRHKSFASISQMINILQNEMNFPLERIIKNGFVLYGDPVNVRRMIDDIKQIGGEDIREVLFRRPKIMMGNSECVKKTIEQIKSHGIAEESINKCLDILTLASDTVQERLRDMDTVEEFRALKSNSRILRLVHFQTKARLRLDYLNQMKIKCASLHVLSSHTNAFVNYTKNGTDKGKGCDMINYLANVLKRSIGEVRESISRHPNWSHVPTLVVTQSYEFLNSKYFTPDDIFENVQVLLYPIERIKTKLVKLQQNECYAELKVPNSNCLTVTNRQMLALILYLIELEFHFTGDGIWTDEDLHPVENFNSILPNFPASWQKGYKYGSNPSLNKLEDKSAAELSI